MLNPRTNKVSGLLTSCPRFSIYKDIVVKQMTVLLHVFQHAGPFVLDPCQLCHVRIKTNWHKLFVCQGRK